MIIVDKLINRNVEKEIAGISYVCLPSVLLYLEVVSKVINRKI